MKLFRLGLVLLGMFALSLQAEAFGKKKSASSCEPSQSHAAVECPPDAPPAPAPGDCGPGGPAAPTGPVYVKQKVTAYKEVQKTKQVDVTTYKTTPVEVPYTWKETVVTPKLSTVQQKYYTTESKSVPFKYTAYEAKTVVETATVHKTVCTPVQETVDVIVNKLVTVPEEITVTKCNYEWVDQPYTWVENQYVTTHEKRLHTTFVCVPKTVEECVPVCKTIQVPVASHGGCGGCGDPCATPAYTCQKVVEYQKVAKTVVERVPQTVETVVPVTKCVPVTKSGTRKVSVAKPYTEKVTVQVTKCVPTPEKQTRTVYKTSVVPEQVTYNVVKCVPVEKEGTKIECFTKENVRDVQVTTYESSVVEKSGKRTEYKTEPVTEKVTQTYSEWVPYETEVDVLVSNGGDGDGHGDEGECAEATSGCGHKAKKCGLFGGGRKLFGGGLFGRCKK